MHTSSIAATQVCATVLGMLLAFGVATPSPTWKTTPFNPPAIPLAVSSPYTSTWLMNGNGTALYDDWSQFWDGFHTGWTGFVNVDGATFRTMGNHSAVVTAPAQQLAMKFTSTSTVFTLRCGPVDFTYTFLSPIDPDDLVRFSLPFSYLVVTAESNDGEAHAVKLYSDIAAEWAAASGDETVTWQTGAGDFITHQIQVGDQRPYQEADNRILHGSVFFATFNRDGVTYRTGFVDDLRKEFIDSGTLTRTLDTDARSISDRSPGVALAVDLGSVGSQGAAEPVVFGIGHARDTAVQYATGERVPYFATKYPRLQDALEFFMNDYKNATRTAALVDAQIEAHASKVSPEYAALVAFTMRQAFAPMELTAGKNADGSVDADDILLFVRQNAGGYNGTINGVDIIYAMWPMFAYINPQLSKAVLEPTLRYAASNAFPSTSCLRDIGPGYPNATGQVPGQALVHPMPIEASADMIIMTLSYTQRSGDASFVNTYYDQLDEWASYLQDNTLNPAKQEEADTVADGAANMTTLAVKGIIALAAMGELAKIVGNTDATTKYSALAQSYIGQWKGMAMSQDGQHLTYSYGNDGSYALMFDLYADKLLKVNIVQPDVFDTQETWYKSHLDTYGVSSDSRFGWSFSNWEIWTAAYMKDTDLQHDFVDRVVAYYSSGLNNVPGANHYELPLQGDQLTVQRGTGDSLSSPSGSAECKSQTSLLTLAFLWLALCVLLL